MAILSKIFPDINLHQCANQQYFPCSLLMKTTQKTNSPLWSNTMFEIFNPSCL